MKAIPAETMLAAPDVTEVQPKLVALKTVLLVELELGF